MSEDKFPAQNCVAARIEPGCLILVRGEWWRVVKIVPPEQDRHGRTLIRVTSESGHSTDYWEPEHIEDVKPYDGVTIEWEKK